MEKNKNMATLSPQQVQDLGLFMATLSIEQKMVVERYRLFCRDILNNSAFAEGKTYNSKRGCSVAIKNTDGIISVYFFTNMFSSAEFGGVSLTLLLELGILSCSGDLWQKISKLNTGASYQQNDKSYLILLKTKNPGNENIQPPNKPKKKKKKNVSSGQYYVYPIRTEYGEVVYRRKQRVDTYEPPKKKFHI